MQNLFSHFTLVKLNINYLCYINNSKSYLCRSIAVLPLRTLTNSIVFTGKSECCNMREVYGECHFHNETWRITQSGCSIIHWYYLLRHHLFLFYKTVTFIIYLPPKKIPDIPYVFLEIFWITENYIFCLDSLPPINSPWGSILQARTYLYHLNTWSVTR